LIQAEQVVLQYHGGCCLRLAGLYNLYRGPHNYWLTSHKETIPSTPYGIVNLLHYEDAANACYHALKLGRSILQPPQQHPSSSTTTTTSPAPNHPSKQNVFLISDGHPLTRYQICQYAQMASYYQNCTIPQFVSPDGSNANNTTTKMNPETALGKIYDGTYSNHRLQWQPKYPSFQHYMLDHATTE
jgi:nucleoside-diphosphate-sugar epimerase